MPGTDIAERLHDVLLRLFGREAPLRIRAWDGSEAGPPDAPVVQFHSRRALRRLLWRPDELGLARAYVAGEVDVDGDLLRALERLAPFGRSIGRRPGLTVADRRELLRTVVLLGAVGPQPKPPPEELTGSERRHVLVRDRAVLGPRDGLGYWADPSYDLADAQRTGHELVCRKLGLTPDARLLDVSCGWGAFLLYAAERYGVTGVGMTLSPEQAEQARKRAVEAGVADRVEIRVADWSELDEGPYDAVVSNGLAEYVGPASFGDYARALYAVLRPGGRLVTHQASRRNSPVAPERSFIDSYVFPGAELLRLGTMVGAFEGAGLEVRDMEAYREHYARTLRSWCADLEADRDGYLVRASYGRTRVWHLYLAVSALAFESGRVGVHQILAGRPHADGRSDLPLTRREWQVS